MNFKTIVAIPVYRDMNAFEKISLQQAVRIFQHEPICLVVPSSLDISNYQSYGDFLVERFDDGWFTGTESYSRLLTDAVFYERFIAYDYLLLYQLDAFVFYDALPHFCSLGYDYYGSPWWRAFYWRLLTGNSVGNGGFSLRHVRHTLELVQRYRKLIRRNWYPLFSFLGEDIFFAWAGTHLGYHTAPLAVAMRFGLERDVGRVYRRLNAQSLPFGVHKWFQRDFAFWRPFIEAAGYKIPEESSAIKRETTHDLRIADAGAYLYARAMMFGDTEALQQIIRSIIPIGRSIYIRGRGTIGRRVAYLLEKLHVNWVRFLEKNDTIPPDAFVIVASIRYEQEIIEELRKNGRVAGRDFISTKDFSRQMLWTWVMKILMR